MKRLAQQDINTPEEFKVDVNKKPDWFDEKRWKAMLKPYKGGNLLDIGCGISPTCKKAMKKSPSSDIRGIDFCQEIIDFMKQKHPQGNYICAGLDYLQTIENDYFNYIISGQLVEHLEDVAGFVKETMRILKPGGILSISTPLGETEAGELDKERHLWSFSVQDVVDLLKPYGKVKIQVLRSDYYPIYRYYFPHIIAFCRKNGNN